VSVKSRRRFDLGWTLVVLLAVFAIAPLTYPGFFEAQSGFLPTFNVGHLSEAPNWGRLPDPVRGEGKLPYLLAWPFFQLSGSGLTAIKWGYGLSFLLGALGVYAWTRPWLGRKGGVLAAVVYTYQPWHLSTVYVRGAYAEAWLWAFWPFVLWATDRLGESRSRSNLVAIAAGLSLLGATFWTQPGLAALATVLLVAYGVTVPAGRPWPLLRLVETIALSLLLLWLAARRSAEARIPFAEHFLHPFQFLSAAWGDGLSFQLGVAAVGLSIVAVALWVSRRDSVQETQGGRPSVEGSASSPSIPSHPSLPAHLVGRAIWFWLGALLVLVLLCLPLTAWLWQITGFDALLTYPWQLLALTGLPLAFLAGSVLRLDERLATLPAWAGLVALVVLASYPYLAPRFTQVDPGPLPVALLQPAGADAPQITILDNEIAMPTEITPTLTLSLTWQALEPIAEDYTAFVHLLGEDNAKAAQIDTRPCEGECPTDGWQPGRIIADRYEFTLAPDVAAELLHAPPGLYRLAVGLYLLDTGERVAVVGREDGTVFLNVP
jgi:hypothetical protein